SAHDRLRHSCPTRRSSDLFPVKVVVLDHREDKSGELVGCAKPRRVGDGRGQGRLRLLGQFSEQWRGKKSRRDGENADAEARELRSEEHTSELQSREKLVCR